MTIVARESVLLLLRLLESSAAAYSQSALVEFHGVRGENLIGSRLVLPVGSCSLGTTDDEEGLPVSISFDRERDEFGYHDSRRGWVVMEESSSRLYRPDIGALMSHLLGDGVRTGNAPRDLVPGMITDIGQMRIVRTKPTSIWFARRLHCQAGASALAEAVTRHPSDLVRLVLTSTQSHAIMTPAPPMTRIIPVADVLSASPPHIIDTRILKLRFEGMEGRPTGELVHLSEDGRVLTINGQSEFHFHGETQIAIIRKIVAAFRTGKWLRASEVLTSVSSSSRTFGQAFGPKWKKLAPFMRKKNGLWRLEP